MNDYDAGSNGELPVAPLPKDSLSTPRTNAVARYLKSEFGALVDSVPVEFARQLERELNAALADLQRHRDRVEGKRS
jgi:hypothetical protein